MSEKFSIKKEAREGVLELTLSGVLDEETQLSGLFTDAGDLVRVNFKGLEKINSCGVREWINVMRELKPGCKIEYMECSIPIVEQLNLITNFMGPGKAISFLAPYYCEACDLEEEVLLMTEEHFPDLDSLEEVPDFKCPKCGGDMSFEEGEEYFIFLEPQLEDE